MRVLRKNFPRKWYSSYDLKDEWVFIGEFLRRVGWQLEDSRQKFLCGKEKTSGKLERASKVEHTELDREKSEVRLGQ